MKKFSDEQIRVLEKPAIECADLELLFGDFVDGELPAALQSRMRSHIEDCKLCQNFEREYREVINVASELKETPIPDGVKQRLREALNNRLGLNLRLC